MNESVVAIGAVATAIIGLAALSVLVGKSSQTASVIGAAGSALAQNISVAVSPVTGSSQTGGAVNSLFSQSGFQGLNI